MWNKNFINEQLSLLHLNNISACKLSILSFLILCYLTNKRFSLPINNPSLICLYSDIKLPSVTLMQSSRICWHSRFYFAYVASLSFESPKLSTHLNFDAALKCYDCVESANTAVMHNWNLSTFKCILICHFRVTYKVVEVFIIMSILLSSSHHQSQNLKYFFSNC